jgi:DNA-binding transcriptional regulator YhcF (GntR family)
VNGRPLPPEIVVDPRRPAPPYEQVRQQIADLILAGVLGAGSRLPPVRQLAADLGLAAGTVARAYQELEAAGLVQTRRGGGTQVLPLRAPAEDRRAGLLAARAAGYLTEARRLGYTDAEAVAAVRAQARG